MADIWPESDAELVRRMLSGDEDAFVRFFDVVYPAMYRFALARVDFDRDTAAELAQGAVCKAIENLRKFRGEAALLTWVCTICRNEVHAYHKQQRRTPEVDLAEDDPEVRAALESLSASSFRELDASLDRERVAALVRRVLDTLPPRYASALEWKYIEELSVHDIAARLGVGVKAAESLLTRARVAFRDAFGTIAWSECNEQ
jgi:RNA polymerase sigma-70 factor (ECF subfamily)